MTVDWARWVPGVRSTLVFVFRGEQVLLIRKLRGLGAGKINAPGGKLDPGESPEDCARRELAEEVGVVADSVQWRGALSFQFVDGLALFCDVFVAGATVGDPVATDEASPIWVARSAIPYDEMWADDAVWIPHLLAGRRFSFRGVFDGDTMLEGALEFSAPHGDA